MAKYRQTFSLVDGRAICTAMSSKFPLCCFCLSRGYWTMQIWWQVWTHLWLYVTNWTRDMHFLSSTSSKLWLCHIV